MTHPQTSLLTIDDILNYRSCGTEEKTRIDDLVRATVSTLLGRELLSVLVAILPESISYRFKIDKNKTLVLEDYQIAVEYSHSAVPFPRSYKVLLSDPAVTAESMTRECLWVVSALSKRLTLGGIYMDVAKRYASLSTCNRRHVGAILVKDGRIISTGTNGSPEGAPHCIDEGCFLDEKNHCQRTVHAEQNAILFCAREGISMKGAAVYCTDFPCTKCLQSILQTGIHAIYFDRDYTDIYNKVLAKSVNIDFFKYDKGLFTKIHEFK